MNTLMILMLLAQPPMQCGTDAECGCTVDCLQQMEEGEQK